MTSSRSSETPPLSDELIVGELVGPFGIAGEVKLYPLTDFPERLQRYRRLTLALPDGSRREVRILRARPHKNLWLLKLRDINKPEEAEALRGSHAIVPAERAEPLPEGHFYLHDVIGLRAVTAAGEELGTVTDVLRSPANDVYVIGDLLIPAVKAIVDRIDPAAGLLVIHSRDVLAIEEVPAEPDAEKADSPQRHRDTEGRQRRLRVNNKRPGRIHQGGEADAASSSPS
jgi:16S rRNA processing protein RimM